MYDGGERPDSLIEEGVGGEFVRAANVFPDQAVLPQGEWEKIVEYYVSQSPEQLPPPSDHPEITTGLDLFELRAPPYRTDPPMTTLVKVGGRANIYVGDAKANAGTLTILDQRFEVKNTVVAPSAISSMQVADTDLFLTLMGDLTPTDRPSGRVVKSFLRSGEARYRSFVTLIDSLQRPVHTAFADLTGDGREDVVVSEFGFQTGTLSWYENVGENQFEKRILRNAPGATRSVVRDFTGDGRPDVMALMAQGDEGIYLFSNEGEGVFEERRILRFPPSYGSTSFELADFDGDGTMDILHAAGDNADYEPVMKPYHGVRIFLNDGDNQFEEAYFYPLNGAYKAVARDFDGDGDLDIAAISFFPDYEHSREESFVYLENLGDFKFAASTFREGAMGRWSVLDAGDIDRDGDEDLVLGSFSALKLGTAYVPERLQAWWQNEGPSVVVLENTTFPKRPRP
jgi:hypothetical protein